MPTILIVDDSSHILNMLSAVFQRAGYSVTTAPDGQSAMALCLGERFDIVLSDVAMPRMTGCELARRLAERCPATQIVLMSGYELPCGECPYSPRCTFVRKPFPLQGLIAAVERAVQRR